MASKKKEAPTNLTERILSGIRADLSAAREELKRTADAIRAEVSERFDRLEHRQTDSDVRVATEMVALAGALASVGEAVKSVGADMRDVKVIVSEIRDDRVRMNALEARIQRLEAKASQ